MMSVSVDMHVLNYSTDPNNLVGAGWFVQCLESLDGEPCEIHVIDGGFENHIGAARAHAFTLGSCDYVSWTDNDDWVLPGGAMQRCIDYLDSHPDCVGVYTDYIAISEAGVIIEQKIKRPWDPLRQLVKATEVLHLHVMRRAAVMRYLAELENWPTFEEYVLLGLIVAHGYWHHLPMMGYAKRSRTRTVSSMRLATPDLWKKAVKRVAPTLIYAKKRYENVPK